MADKKWYVVRAMGGQEKKVTAYIESEISRLNLEDYISQVLVPTEKVYQIRNGKKVSKERNFFPGYILIEADLVGEIPHTIKGIPGVIGFLGATKGGEPVPMRQSDLGLQPDARYSTICSGFSMNPSPDWGIDIKGTPFCSGC